VKTIFIILSLISFNIFAIEKLKLIGDINFETGTKFKDTEIGGLSGLVYDQGTKRLLVISDDRSQNNPARFYEFELSLSEKSFKVSPFDVITLKDSTGNNFKKNEIDFEGITIRNGKVIISSEGSLNKEKPILPAIFEFERSGKFSRNYEVPSKFLPSTNSKDAKQGARDNLVFEALSSSKDGKLLLVGTEESLMQDDNVSTPSYASKTRIIQYVDDKPKKEMLYQLDQVPAVSVAGLTVGETGLVDFAIIDENSSYSLERAFLPLTKKTFIKIFKISNFKDATDVTSYESIKGKEKEIKMVDKELVLSLDDIVKTFSDKFQSTDNIEGICFGPTLANGHQTLIVVSDNNFSKFQRTQFLAFEILP
jgi:3-phytase